MRNKGRVLFSLMLVAVIFLTPYLGIIPVKANPLTTVTLDLQDETPEVDVSPGSNGIVEVAGEVTCDKYGPDEVKVFLTGQSETGSCNVEPPSFVFSGVSGSEETRTFTVTTRVPMGYTSKATPELSVQGSFDQGGLHTNIPPVSTMIVVLQYYKMEYSTPNRGIQCKSGDNAEIKFTLVNAGNGDDSFQIDFKNREALENEGFNLPTTLEVHLSEDMNDTIKFHLGVPEDISGEYEVQILIISRGSMDSGTQEEATISVLLDVQPQGIGETIGSFVTSPLGIGIIVVVIVVAIILKLKQKKKVPSLTE